MPKRQLRDVDGQSKPPKRPRIVHEAPTSEEVQTARQLQQLLTFDQDLKRARHGVQSLKVFLDGFGSDSRDADRRALLKEYLEAAQPRVTSEDAVYLADVMEMWTFGSQVHNDSITAAVPAALALLLQAASSSLDLLPHALGIAQTLLQERQLKLISRNLSSSKGSGFIISPTLRLLREVASLDGGALAKRLFRARDFTFASFARNLEVKNPGEGVEDPAKPSVRTNAIKYFLTCLKFLHADAKKELLAQKEVVSHLTFLLKDDPPYLILEMLDSLKRYVLNDDKVPREAKFRAFGTKTLDRLAGLYNYRHDEEGEAEGNGKTTVKAAVHEFLTHACTNSSAGVLYTGTGMYPKDLEDEAAQDLKDSDDLALERAGWMDKYTEEVPVANFALDDFLQKLRPWSSLRHSELLVSIFGAAPELVASYFLSNKSFGFEPKLSMTWIGYAAFLFNTVQLPLPRYFGNRSGYRRIPPPTSIVLDNVLPPPLKQKDLSRCLSNKSNLVSFFAVRILVLALQKLGRALEMHREAAGTTNKPVWESAARRLVDDFCQRIPDMKEVINCYKAVPEASVLQREAASRLLLLYYEVIPQVALTANYDVSPFLLAALARLNSNAQGNQQEQALWLMELENLLAIAGYSPGMRWFAKAEGLSASPFVALLRVCATSSQVGSLTRLREVLRFVATQNQLVQGQTELGLLLRPLQEMRSEKLDPVWALLDNCANRCAGSPLKYLEYMEDLAAAEAPENRKTADGKRTKGTKERSPVSLLLVTMAEQLPFALKGAEPADLNTLVKAISSFLGFARAAGEDERIIKLLAERMNTTTLASYPGAAAEIKPKFKAPLADGTTASTTSNGIDPIARLDGGGGGGGSRTSATSELDQDALRSALHVPSALEEDNSALVKWSSKAVDELVDGNHIAALMRLLWSEHASIRQEALTNLLKMAAKIRESSYEDKSQLWLLLSELAESSRGLVARGPVPGPLVAFAIHSLEVIKNPLHCLYVKVNTFLTKAPIWAPDRVPLAHDVLHGEPSEDDRYYAEISWLLTYLLDALRTQRDLSVFHQKKWFEKILALAGNPYLRTNLTTRILRIVYRSTCIEGGSTTLVTRFGVMSWLEGQEAAWRGLGDEDAAALCKALSRRVWATCDRERVAAWSKGGLPGTLSLEDRST